MMMRDAYGLRLGAGEGFSGFAKGVIGSSVSPAGKTII